MAYTPFPSNTRRHPSPSDDGDPTDDGRSTVASQAAQSSEPYYANDEIEILHEIITEAQGAIDRAKEPKPLPVQALFKAYDRILPEHGIDPDSDHHLSTFIFRVGGERGDLSLLGKFHAILERMGIVIEFGEGDAASVVSAPSHIAPDQPTDQLSYENQRPVTREGSGPKSPSAHSLDYSPKNGQDIEGEETPPPPRKTALLSALNRWANASAENRPNGHRPLPTVTKAGPSRERPAPPELSDVIEHDIEQTTDRLPARSTPLSHDYALQGVEDKDASPVAPRPSILPILDRLGLLPRSRPESPLSQSTLPSQVSGPPSIRDVRQPVAGYPKDGKAHLPRIIENESAIHRMPRDDTVKVSESPNQQTPSIRSELDEQQPRGQSPTHRPVQQVIPVTPHQQQGQAGLRPTEGERESERLLRRACRAREIFIASKAFNHWADKTARRLEREAVARRHMIRFKCFRGWSQGPSSVDDEAQRLRATTAVQKLRRAVAEHEEQLRLAALAASQNRRIKTVVGALDKWARHKAESEVRLKLAQQSRIRAATGWLTKAHEHRGAEEHAAKQHKLHSESKAIASWAHQADIGVTRDNAAKKIGDHRVSRTCLAQWWDQAELQRRASAYHREIMLDRAQHYFEQWNLQARRQAFLWRNEYVSVRKAFDIWEKSAQEDRRTQSWAARMSEVRLKVKYTDVWADTETQHQQLERLSSRACLYIRGTRIFTVFKQTVEQRQARRREAVKRHLAMRYKQVSGARKRRIFFATLDKWRHAASVSLDQAERAMQICNARDSTSRANTLATWLDESARDERMHYEAQLYHTLPTLDAWGAWSQEQEDMSVQALDMITTGKRIQFQKLWSISSLQHGGLAHTASMVAQKHHREKRNRVLQIWRLHSDKGEGLAVTALSQRRDRFAASDGPKTSFRLPGQRNLIRGGIDGRRQSTGMFETPTRWTGQALPMESLFANRPMPPVREADEEHTPTSSRLGDDDVLEPSPRPMKTMRITTVPRSSTTPKAPVPTHVEEEFRAQLRPATATATGSGTGSTGQKTPFRPSRPSRRDWGTSMGGPSLDGSLSIPPATHSQSQSAQSGPIMSSSGRSGASRFRIPVSARPALRQPGTQSVAGATTTPLRNNIFSGRSQSQTSSLSRSFDPRLR